MKMLYENALIHLYPTLIMITNSQGKKRLHGALPTIGIRPTIDGRMNGVRESLEEQTSSLAIAVADFLETSLIHPNGLPVKCIMADSTIGGVSEAAKYNGRLSFFLIRFPQQGQAPLRT